MVDALDPHYGRSGPRPPTTLEWLCLAGGLFLTLRYAWIFDDAFVYFRYVDNWTLLGLGLVQNQGEYVEGFTSPAWLLLLAALRRAHLGYWTIIRAVGCAAFAVFWLLLVVLQRRLYTGRRPVNLPLAYLALNYGVTSYFTSGLETPLVQVVAVGYALYILNPASRGLALLVAASPLVRPELVAPAVLCGAWSWWREGRFPARLALGLLASTGGWELFRIWYYADLLPNTFHLKNMVDVPQGLLYVRNTFETYHAYLVGAAGLALLGLLAATRRPDERLHLPARGVMALAASSVLIYVIRIGGAPSHYRFMTFSFALLVCALGGIPDLWLDRPHLRWAPVAATAVGLLIAVPVAAAYPPQQTRHPLIEQTFEMVDKIEDPTDDRAQRLWRFRLDARHLRGYRKAHPEWRYVEVRVDHNCHWNYVYFDRYIVHALGLTDAILARTEMPADRPAHKMGLIDLAFDMQRMMGAVAPRGPGVYRRAVEAGTAPLWVANNLPAIEVIERKIYNRHRLGENLRLALAFPRVQP